jgi:hypothetical protein
MDEEEGEREWGRKGEVMDGEEGRAETAEDRRDGDEVTRREGWEGIEGRNGEIEKRGMERIKRGTRVGGEAKANVEVDVEWRVRERVRDREGERATALSMLCPSVSYPYFPPPLSTTNLSLFYTHTSSSTYLQFRRIIGQGNMGAVWMGVWRGTKVKPFNTYKDALVVG